MSLNNVQSTQNGHFDLLPEENVLSGPHQAEIELRIPPTLAGPKRTCKGKGQFYVTDQRIIFLREEYNASKGSSSSSGANSLPPAYDDAELRNLAIPYTTLLSCGFELPIFSQNYISLSFLPDPLDAHNNLPSLGRGADIQASLWIADGAGHGVWKRIEGERQRTEARREEGEMLPAYEQ